MSRSLAFVLAGSLWTVASTVTFAQVIFPLSHLSVPILVLASCVGMTSILYLAASLARSLSGRHIATLLHLSVPLVWVTWLELTSQSWLDAQQWVMFAGCAFFGAALADQGVAAEDVATVRTTTPTFTPARNASDGFRLSQLTAFDSGGFPVRQLSAADSGSFRLR